jgi:hypothetical protein
MKRRTVGQVVDAKVIMSKKWGTMNKKLANVVAFFLDLLGIEGLWFGYQEFDRILMQVASQADRIIFSNRVGFYIICVGFPLIHLLGIIEHIWPDFSKKYNLINRSLAIMAVGLLTAGIIGSAWITSQVKNAGYIYCRQASGVSALARSLVFTKEMKICEEMVAAFHTDSTDSPSSSNFKF